MFVKNGESLNILGIESVESVLPSINEEILNDFRKTAASLKQIAPKADDFLYFSAIMMHAAEASALNDDGTQRLTLRGEPVKVSWDTSNDTWRWQSNDQNIKPYKNANGDIFPESELIKAHKKWVGKPLCIDHKSSSVDHVRGFIVDTYYDRGLKRVIALCALDKKNYPDLARKVETGYSHSVSMGTAVGRAICTDCARVARAEADFCDHMRRKNGYGEINVDLNPIELSIVVNPADQKAHIKHIIAAANTLNQYVESKSKELNKIADKYFSASLVFNSAGNGTDAKSTSFSINAGDLETFKSELDTAFKKLEEINSEVSEKDTNYSASPQTASAIDMKEGAPNGVEPALAPPHQRFASSDPEAGSLEELRMVTANIQVTLSQMKNNLEKLTSIVITNKQEENMSGSNKTISKEAYYQGTEEPTPGQPKYSKDPLNEKLRDGGDKQMVGQMDTGPVDGMHPGPDSVGMSELERKKMLARAAAEERALKRAAIVGLAKKAYEKTAEVPWTALVDPAAAELREKDEMMASGLKTAGAAGNASSCLSVLDSFNGKYGALGPNAMELRNALNKAVNKSASLESSAYFLGGGGVNEPTPGKVKYPADKMNEQLREKEDKQMVGQKPFPGVGPVDGLHPSPSSADTSDELKRKEMLRRADALRARFVTAQKNDGSTDIDNSSWEVFAGDKLLLTASVDELTNGRSEMLFDSVATKEFGAKLINTIKAQGAGKIISMIKKAQEVPAAPAPEAPVVDEGKSADPKEKAVELAAQNVEVAADLKEAVDALTGHQAEMGDIGSVPEMGAAASFGLSTLRKLGSEISQGLVSAMKETIADLKSNEEELNMITAIYDNGSVSKANSELAKTVSAQTFAQTDALIAQAYELMAGYVEYARGTQALAKKAQIEAELNKLANVESKDEDMDASDTNNLDLDDSELDLDSLGLDEELDGLDIETDSDLGLDDVDTSVEDLLSAEDANDVTVELPKGAPMPEGLTDKDTVVVASLNTKAGRAALRAKLAADLKVSPHLHEAHPQGGFTTELDVKPSDGLAKVEDLEEVHDAMLDLAKAPVKVRKDAETIHKLVVSGKLSKAEVDALVAEGVDKEAVAYYKKFYGQVDGGSEFASELTKERVKASVANELETYKVKMARAYELAYDMVERGMLHNDRMTVTAEVERIMACDDTSFETLKRVVARRAPVSMRKEASQLPQIGVIDSETSVKTASLKEELEAVLSTSKRKLF